MAEKSCTNENKRWIAYWWKYDDGTVGAALLDMEKGKGERLRYAEAFGRRAELEPTLEKWRRECKEAGCTLKRVKLKLHSGVKYFRQYDKTKRSKKRGIYGWQELNKFLNSCGTDKDNRREVLRLFSSILSGYCARMISSVVQKEHPAPLRECAPTVLIGDSGATFDFLLQTICALGLLTDYGCAVLKEKSAGMLPYTMTQRSINDCAFLYIKDGKKKKHRFPAQYRDTTVLIHGRFFSGKEIRSFVRRNRWVSCVLLDAPAKNGDMLPVKLKPALLSCIDYEWDTEAIRYLVERFICFLADLQDQEDWRKRQKQGLKDIERCLLRYSIQQHVQRLTPTETHILRLQLLTLDLFLRSCREDKVIDKQEKSWIQAVWFNLLLPNCCEIPERPGSEEDQATALVSDPREDAIHTFEETLTKMLEKENLLHFPYIAPGELYDRCNPDNSEIHYWGYLRSYAPGKDQAKAFPALAFRERDFREFAAGFLQEEDDLGYIIRTLRKGGTAYYFKTGKMGFPEEKGDKKKTSALILNINEMSFLPNEVKETLLEKISVIGEQSPES